MSQAETLLEVENLRVGYGAVPVVHGASVSVPPRTLVGIEGPNGAGKSTLLKGIIGLLPAMGGRVALAGRQLDGMPCYQRVRSGLALVPDGRQILGSLTVTGNLDIVEYGRRRAGERPGEFSREELLDMFPVLRERSHQMGGSLSGGEQQMLAFARALLCNPTVLLVDEPTQGLAPPVVEQLHDVLIQLKERTSIVLVEQNIDFMAPLADIRLSMSMGLCQLIADGQQLSRPGGGTP